MFRVAFRRRMFSVAICALVSLVPLAAGCSSSPYVSGYSYYPQPALVQVYRRNTTGQTGQASQTPLTVLATILGIHKTDRNHHIPYSVALRLRFENNGPSRITFDPHSMELVTGTLMAFGPPITTPPNATGLSPGQRAEYTAYFPFPPNTTAEKVNVEHFRLRWQVQIDGYPVLQTALFDRSVTGSPSDGEPPPTNGDVY